MEDEFAKNFTYMCDPKKRARYKGTKETGPDCVSHTKGTGACSFDGRCTLKSIQSVKIRSSCTGSLYSRHVGQKLKHYVWEGSGKWLVSAITRIARPKQADPEDVDITLKEVSTGRVRRVDGRDTFAMQVVRK